MSAPDELSIHFSRLHAGDAAAAEAVWRAYFEKLVRVARKRLADHERRVADEEDVALSAMHSFCRGVAEKKHDGVRDRDALWRLLVTITARKASKQRRRQGAQKRGGGAVHGESVFLKAVGDHDGDLAGIGNVLGNEPTPEFSAAVSENCNRLLAALDDPQLRELALLKLAGHTNEELARRYDCVPRTIERKLNLIRVKWSSAE